MFSFLPKHKPLENKGGHAVSIPSRKHQEKGEDYRHENCSWQAKVARFMGRHQLLLYTPILPLYFLFILPQKSQSILSTLYFLPLSELGAGNLLDEAFSIILFPFFLSSPHFSVECALSYGAYKQLLVFSTGPRAVCSHFEYECSSFVGRRRKIRLHFSVCPCCKTNV